jgi:methylase of polypeptide subunit release factors
MAMTLDEWLRAAHASIDLRDAQVLACHALGCGRAVLIARGRDPLDAAQQAVLQALLDRRAANGTAKARSTHRDAADISTRHCMDIPGAVT